MFGSEKYNTPATDAGELSEPTNQVIPKRHCSQSLSEMEFQVMGHHHHAVLNPGECNIPSTQYVTTPELKCLLEHKWLLEHINLNDRALQALLLMHQVVPYPMVSDAQLDGSHQQRSTVNLFHNSVPYNSVLSQVDFPGNIVEEYQRLRVVPIQYDLIGRLRELPSICGWCVVLVLLQSKHTA
jgi:hypothetical protein